MRTSPSGPGSSRSVESGGREPGGGSGRQLCQGRVALRELVRNGQDVSIRVDGDHSLTLQGLLNATPSVAGRLIVTYRV
jgi:hypothetical protein